MISLLLKQALQIAVEKIEEVGLRWQYRIFKIKRKIQ